MRSSRLEDLALVVDPARKVLADLDPGEVPGRLAAVATQNRPVLVRPLQRRLIDEVDRNEWLREQVAERFDGVVDAEDPLERMAALFLHRPEGWEDDIEDMEKASERSERDEQSERIESLNRCIEGLRTELDSWRNRAKRYRRRAKEAAEQADRRVAAARSEALEQRDEGPIRELQRDNRALRKELERIATEREELGGRLAEVRTELRKERRADRSVESVPVRSAWAALNLLDAARLLDDVVEAFSPESAFREPRAITGAEPFDLPLGTPPDDPAAIEWLLAVERDFLLLVDGYNVAFHLDRIRFNTPDIRRRLEKDLARLKGLARGRPRVALVYDSDQSGDTTRGPGPAGIEIRFTSTGHSADDEILALAAQHGTATVVVSSDRRVREGAQSSGSLGLWSEALAGWMLNS